MALSNLTVKATYQGDGANDTFAIPFDPIVDDSAETLVYIRDETADPVTEALKAEGTLNDYTLTGAVLPADFHNNVVFNAGKIPTATQKVIVKRILPLTQTLALTNSNFSSANVNKAFDRVVAMIQQLDEALSRAPLLSPTEQEVQIVLPDPAADTFLKWNLAGTNLENSELTETELIQMFADMQQALTDALAAQAAAETAQAAAEAAEAAAEAAQAAAEAAAAGIGSGGYSGYSARFSEVFATSNLDDTILQILNLQYTAPGMSFSASGSGTIREKGDPVIASTLTAVITKRSDPIAQVRFYKGASLLSTVLSPNPAGGTEQYSWTGSFTDNTTFSSQVDDTGATGGPSTTTGSASFTFVYPYYYGAGAAGLTAAQVAALTKQVIASTASKLESIVAANGNVFYFAYPASYGALTSILDVNGFETIGDWTLRTENITGLDLSAVSYRIYEFNNPVTAGTYDYTFIR